MYKLIGLFLIAIFISACHEKKIDSLPIKQANWKEHRAKIDNFDNYVIGKAYLPIYSHIYHIHEHMTFDLTATVSIRNISTTDSIYLKKADYYNTTGGKVREYLKFPVYLVPLETIEIIIEEQDFEGGSGANFIFEWAATNEKNPPLFEAVMISTYGQQGLSFTTRGVSIID